MSAGRARKIVPTGVNREKAEGEVLRSSGLARLTGCCDPAYSSTGTPGFQVAR